MKFSRQTLFERMKKRSLIYSGAFAILFSIMFFAVGNRLSEDMDIFFGASVGGSLLLGGVISLFGLFWEMVYGDKDPRSDPVHDGYRKNSEK